MKLILIIAICFLNIQCKSTTQKNNTDNNYPTISHNIFDTFLKKYVSENGNVDYKAIADNIEELDQYLKLLKDNAPSDKWTVNQQKAYWINAYNAFTIKLIINNYPLKSIKDINGILSSPWDLKFITIKGSKYTLNHIEHKILRNKYDDPRIHFAINCASYSCPRLLNGAYLPDILDKQLEEQAIEFINDTKKNIISVDKITISEIFKWFKKDFTKDGDIIDYLNNYSRVKINKSAKIDFIKYDWRLNEKDK